jgi:hypothetical protein
MNFDTATIPLDAIGYVLLDHNSTTMRSKLTSVQLATPFIISGRYSLNFDGLNIFQDSSRTSWRTRRRLSG